MLDLFRWALDFFLHLDKHLGAALDQYGPQVYWLLFAIIFLETGLVVTPFLPGDSLLFAAGTFAGMGKLNLFVLFGLLATAAIIGDTVNYWVGRKIGPKVFHRENSRLLNKKHLVRTQEFYERHGGKTIILARFIPIIRTFAPFVAGIGKMSYARFIAYNVIGGIAWVGICLSAGYWFGDKKIVQENFSLVIIAIVLISVAPAVVEVLRGWLKSRAAAKSEAGHG